MIFFVASDIVSRFCLQFISVRFVSFCFVDLNDVVFVSLLSRQLQCCVQVWRRTEDGWLKHVWSLVSCTYSAPLTQVTTALFSTHYLFSLTRSLSHSLTLSPHSRLHTGVKAAACYVCRNLSKSVKTLRTALVDAGVVLPIMKVNFKNNKNSGSENNSKCYLSGSFVKIGIFFSFFVLLAVEW